MIDLIECSKESYYVRQDLTYLLRAVSSSCSDIIAMYSPKPFDDKTNQVFENDLLIPLANNMHAVLSLKYDKDYIVKCSKQIDVSKNLLYLHVKYTYYTNVWDPLGYVCHTLC